MPAEEYSLASVYSFIEHQAGSSLRTWLEAQFVVGIVPQTGAFFEF